MSYRVLVIEDDSALADVLRMKLVRQGHEVTIAPSQRDAYHLLSDESFDFALLDLRLPTHPGDMDPNAEVGFDILKHIRDRFTADRFPVIVMTAYEDTSQTAVRALRSGANDYITKPFEDSPITLDAKLEEVTSCIQQLRLREATSEAPARKPHTIVFSNARVEVNGILVQGRAADLLRLLARRTLMLSVGGANDDRPRMPGKEIAKAMSVEEATVRQYVTRFRKWIAVEYEARKLGAIDDQAIVRNARDWKGYDLNREDCDIRLT